MKRKKNSYAISAMTLKKICAVNSKTLTTLINEDK